MSSDIRSTSSVARVGDLSRMNEEIHLSSLRCRENSFLPVFSLPSELLGLIFIHAAQDYYEHSDSYPISHIPDWVNVSYVCRHWRNVALNCPTLWTYHFNLSLRWTEELLRRSRQAPLKIAYVDTDRAISWWSGFLDNLQNHSERIQELCLHISPSDLPAELFLRVPLLEVLMIKTNEPYDGRLVITDAGRPVLRTIGLENCSLQWHLLNLSKLEVLSLSHNSPPEQFDFVELLTALRSMPNLIVLHINNAIPDEVMSSGDYGVSNKINLPRLDFLVVNGTLRVLTFLFSCVEIPLETRISLVLWLEHDPPRPVEDFAPISSFLAQRFDAGQSSTSGPVIRSLGMYLGRCSSLTFSSLEYDCRSRSVYRFSELDSTVPLEIIFRNEIEDTGLDGGTALLHPIMANICCSLPLNHVQTLFVHGDGFAYKFNFWREVFECLDDLRYLKMDFIYMPDLSMLSLAAPKPEENSDGEPTGAQDPSSGRILLPALEKVMLGAVRFLPDHITEHHSGMSRKAFMDILSARNVPRHKVIVRQYRVVPDWFEM